jgi:fructose-1,6-bisphosphatase/inositol monophosphatase family enzyme
LSQKQETHEFTRGVAHLFYAVDGKGAYRNTEPLSVTDKEDLGTSYYMLSGKGRTRIQSYVAELNDWNQQISSAIAGEGWVASGWCDIGVFGALAPWDMAVGVVLIREAGGVMKEATSRSEKWEDIQEGRVVFGNEEIVDSTIDALSKNALITIKNTTYNY